MIEKQVNIGILASLAARGRSKQIQVFDAELPELGLVLLKPGYGLVAFHAGCVAEIGPRRIRVDRLPGYVPRNTTSASTAFTP